jgi:hypothetical protein
MRVLVEKRVNDRTMDTLGVVLNDELPVTVERVHFAMDSA